MFSPTRFELASRGVSVGSRMRFCSILLSMSFGLLYGQGNSNTVRQFNNQVLQLHDQLQQTPAGQRGAIQQQASGVFAQRAAALGALIQQDPGEALRLGFSQDLLTILSDAFPQAASSLESYGIWEGPAEYIVADDVSFRSSTAMVTMTSGQEKLNVHFSGAIPNGLQCGAILHVEGMRVSADLAASISTVQPASSTTSTAASASPGCSTTGTQNIAVLLVTFPGVPSPISSSDLYNVFFGTSGRSLNGYWHEASNGLTSATGNVFGPYTLPSSYTCDQYSSILSAASAAANADVYFPNYNRIFVSFPLPSGCTWGGLSTIGCTSITSADGTSTASTSWVISNYLVPNDQGVELVAHEGGHGLTLEHARSRGFAPDALGPLGASGTLSEYGDNFDPMGYYNLGHYGPQHKQQLGWLNPSNVLTVQSGGTYSLAPYGLNTTSLQAIQVQRGTGNPDWLWVEYHQPIGNYEPTLSSQIFSGATIRYLDSQTGSGYTNLLDFTPQDGSWYDPALAAGLSWQDPYTNLSLRIGSATANGLTVGVTYGSTPCTPGSPTITMSPSNPSVNPGASVNYSVTVKNGDSSGCSSSIFNLSSTQPAGWPAAYSSSSVSLGPGQSTSVTLTESVPATALPGTYPVTSGANDSTMSASAAANATVMSPPPPPPLSVSLTLSSSTYKAKSTVPITAQVVSGTNAAAGASVVFTLTGLNGNTTTKTVTASSTGTAVWNYKAMQRGTYSVNAKATLSSAAATSGTATFQVQ